MPKDRRTQRDIHALTPEGMVLCNPRDKEAAHRAEMADIATADTTAEREQVTCPQVPEAALSAEAGRTVVRLQGVAL